MSPESHDLSERILKLVARGRGVRLSDIEKAFDGIASRRTLSRRLDELVTLRRIDRIGKARAAVYRTLHRIKIIPGERMVDVIREPLAVYGGEGDVPLSDEARWLQQQVQRDVSLRPHVSYQRPLLEDYRPNETFYLSESDRERLIGYDVLYGAAMPQGSYGRAMMRYLLVDLAWSSSRLEGSSYTRAETQRLIEEGVAAENKSQEELQMVLNHKEAIEFMLCGDPDIGFNSYTILNLHALLSDNLVGTYDRGRLRSGPIRISGSAYTPLTDTRQIEQLFSMLLEKAAAISNPFEQSFFTLVHLPYLQPFWDVNKRVSRIAANIPLIRTQKCPLSFVDVPRRTYLHAMLGVYELNRMELLRELFIWAYDRSCRDYENLTDKESSVNPLRLKYRASLREIVAGIVRAGESADAQTVARRATSLVDRTDLQGFVDLALAEFAGLQEGNIALYRVSLSDYRKWIRGK